MNKYSFIVVLLMLVIVTACSGSQSTEALPTVVLDNGTPSASAQVAPSGGIKASGVVAPSSQSQLSFLAGGTVTSILASEGETVEAGQALAQLDDSIARQQYELAKLNLANLTSPAAVAAAQLAVVDAQRAVDDARKTVDSLEYPRATDKTIKETLEDIEDARDMVNKANQAYNSLPDGDPRKAAAKEAASNAQKYLNNLIATYNWYTGEPSDLDIMEDHATLDAANAALQEAQWYLSALLGEDIPEEATGPNLAALDAAKLNFLTAQELLANTTLMAPIPGVVANLDLVVNQRVNPGQVVAVVSTVADMIVETTDLSELDVAGVKVGQPVTVAVDALNKDIGGHVTGIATLPTSLGGDVVYKVTVALDVFPPELKPGMSVEVTFLQE